VPLQLLLLLRRFILKGVHVLVVDLQYHVAATGQTKKWAVCSFAS
jgi:hypothetical protein